MNIPESELQIDFARSGGPGGQNVNKVESKVIIRWSVGESGHFDDAQKVKIREAAGKRLNQEDEIVIDSDESRSQVNNRERAVEKLEDLVKEALKPVKPRRATKPSRGQREKRLQNKKKQSTKKALRKNPEY